MSTKEIIAVDVDEVLLPTMPYLVDWHNANHDSALTINDYFTTELWHVWGNTREEAIEKCLNFHQKIDLIDMTPMESAASVLRNLRKNYDLAVVTSRHYELKDTTIKWLDENFAGVFNDHLFGNHFNFSAPGPSKGELCRGINASYLIDDSLKHVTECAKTGIKCLLFGNYAWNFAEELPENITRVGNWNAVGRYFQQAKAVKSL